MQNIEILSSLTNRPFTIYRASGRNNRGTLKYPHWVFRISFPNKKNHSVEEKTFKSKSLDKLVIKAGKYLLTRLL